MGVHLRYFESVESRRNSIANELELCLSCTNPSICKCFGDTPSNVIQLNDWSRLRKFSKILESASIKHQSDADRCLIDVDPWSFAIGDLDQNCNISIMYISFHWNGIRLIVLRWLTVIAHDQIPNTSRTAGLLTIILETILWRSPLWHIVERSMNFCLS